MPTYNIAGADTYNPGASGTLVIECIGGGQDGSASTPGAGGKGAYYSKKTMAVTAISYDLFVGTRGAGAGTDSWFNTTGTVIAPGGNSGTTAIGDTTNAGGAAGTAGAGGGGGGGGSGGSAAVGNAGTNGGAPDGGPGGAAVTGGGAGGAGGTAGGAAAVVGSQPGGGGGGGDFAVPGAIGGVGRITLTFTPDVTNYTLVCAAGTFTLTGISAGLRAARTMPAAVGAFTLTGVAAALRCTRALPCSVGAFTLTGQTAGLRATRTLTCGPGTFTLTGVSVSSLLARKITAAVGSFVLTGQDATLRADRIIYRPRTGESTDSRSRAVQGADSRFGMPESPV